jgi:hypothetical protein
LIPPFAGPAQFKREAFSRPDVGSVAAMEQNA